MSQKMNPEVKPLLLEMLRSGGYKQSSQSLKHDDAFCFLGICCELHRKTFSENEWESGGSTERDYYYMDNMVRLPDSVMEWAGFNSPWGPSLHITNTQRDELHLTNTTSEVFVLNDRGLPFKDIADLIEAQL